MCRQLSLLCTVDFSLFCLISMLVDMLQSCCEHEQSSSSDWNKKNSQLANILTLVYLFLAQLLIIRGEIVPARMLLCLIKHHCLLVCHLPPKVLPLVCLPAALFGQYTPRESKCHKTCQTYSWLQVIKCCCLSPLFQMTLLKTYGTVK